MEYRLPTVDTGHLDKMKSYAGSLWLFMVVIKAAVVWETHVKARHTQIRLTSQIYVI